MTKFFIYYNNTLLNDGKRIFLKSLNVDSETKKLVPEWTSDETECEWFNDEWLVKQFVAKLQSYVQPFEVVDYDCISKPIESECISIKEKLSETEYRNIQRLMDFIDVSDLPPDLKKLHSELCFWDDDMEGEE